MDCFCGGEKDSGSASVGEKKSQGSQGRLLWRINKKVSICGREINKGSASVWDK